MSTGAVGRPHPPTADIATYAQQLATAAPPLTAEQLDALGQIMRSTPTVAGPPHPKSARTKRSKHWQLQLPYDQVDAQPASVVVHGREIVRVKRIGDVKEHPVTEMG